MPWASALFSAVAAPLIGGVVSSVFAPSSPAPGAVTPGTAGSTSAQGAAAVADPFAAQRPQYQAQLNQMMQPGAQFNASDPSYAFRFNQGLDALQRTQAASGQTGSGAALLAAQQYGQGSASQEYQNQFNRLSQLAGVGAGSPGAAGQILNQAGQTQQAGATAAGNLLGNAAVAGWDAYKGAQNKATLTAQEQAIAQAQSQGQLAVPYATPAQTFSMTALAGPPATGQNALVNSMGMNAATPWTFQ